MAPALRLHDQRTGGLVELPRRAMLRIGLPGGELRPRVVADLLRRVAARQGRTVFTVSPESPGSAQGAAWADYNLLPVDSGPVEDVDVQVGGRPAAGLCLAVPPEPAGWASGIDPLCARLALLSVRYREPFDPGPEHRAEADSRLDRWRGLVARWAGSPGRPMDRRYTDEAQEALAGDLDSPAAIAVLDRLAEDPDVAPGAKLETFIHLDLLLALDLVRDIGRR